MKFLFDAVAISVQERESNKKKYYRINVDQDGEIITLECDENVAGKIKKYSSYHFHGVYVRGEYEGRVFTRMSVVDAHPVSEQASGAK